MKIDIKAAINRLIHHFRVGSKVKDVEYKCGHVIRKRVFNKKHINNKLEFYRSQLCPECKSRNGKNGERV
ncbi:MAG: hypothetical protein ACOCRO_11565 [Halanaerobiales bacterium]